MVKFMLNKKGVSLVTVLLFMLVATIAATATFKWLTSQGILSGSRMMQNEAVQAAKAGINNAKSWMTYNGNETGALIRQFSLNGGKPINLNNILADLNSSKQNFDVQLVGVEVTAGAYKLKLLSTGVARNGSKHSEVAVLNVSGLYQVRVPQEKAAKAIAYDYAYFGGSLDFAGDHSLTSAAINGSWTGNPVNVDKHFVVTGDLDLNGNDAVVNALTCVGGSISVNNGAYFKELYVEGSLTNFNGTVEGNAYLNGDVTLGNTSKKQTASNHKNPGLEVGGLHLNGNVSLNGRMEVDLNTYSGNIGGNLCLLKKESGKIVFAGSNNNFELKGNVWSKSKFPFKSKDHNNNNDEKMDWKGAPGTPAAQIYRFNPSQQSNVMIGSQNTSKLYADNFLDLSQYYCYSSDNYTCNNLKDSKCGVDYNCYASPIAEYNGYAQRYYSLRTKGTLAVSYKEPGDGECAEALIEQCNQYWEESPGCPAIAKGPMIKSMSTRCSEEQGCNDGTYFCEGTEVYWPVAYATCNVYSKIMQKSKYKIPEALVTGIDEFSKKENAFTKYDNPACKALAKDKKFDENVVEDLNSCYAALATDPNGKDYLYNGFLVANFNATEDKSTDNKTLKGKFVLIFDEKVKLKLPKTTEELLADGSHTMVFVYLEKGATEVNASQESNYRYFIYTKADIDYFKLDKKLLGSVYGTAESCAKVKLNGGSNGEIEYDKDIVDALSEAGVLCPANVTNCGSTSVTPTPASSSSSSETVNAMDTYHIAVGPQLSVVIESQYQNAEDYKESDETLEPSILLLPRVIYLPKNPIGSLGDYFDIAPLNGAVALKDPNRIGSCEPALSTNWNPTAKLYRDKVPLAEGIHKCSYNAGETYGNINFYVVVKGEETELPKVKFAESYRELDPNSSLEEKKKAVVSLKVEGTPSKAQMSVDIMEEKIPTSWSFINQQSGSDYSVRVINSDSYGKTYRVTFSKAGNYPLFSYDINGATNITPGSVTYQAVEPCDGCMIGTPGAEQIRITGTATVKRDSLKTYCQKYSCDEEINGVKLSEIQKRPNCDIASSKVWVSANGDGCVPNGANANDSWQCRIGTPVTLQNQYNEKVCEVFIPSDNNTLTTLSTNPDENVLYADIKKKPVELTINFVGAKGGEKVHVLQQNATTGKWEDVPSIGPLTSSGTVTVYAGESYRLAQEKGSSTFNYWLCVSGDNCFTGTPSVDTIPANLSSSKTIEVHYNGRDLHCFYEDFTDLDKKCNNGHIDDESCIDRCGLTKNDGSSCDVAGLAVSGKDWMLMYGNDANGSNSQNGNFVQIKNGIISRPSYGNGEAENGGYTSKNGKKEDAKGSPTLILSRVEGGQEGRMTSIFTTDVLYKDKSEAHFRKESGFIFRSNSNATEYFSLTIYGERNVDARDIWLPNKITCDTKGICASNKIIAKVCQVYGVKVTDPGNQCVSTELKSNNTNNFFNTEYIVDKPLILDAKVEGTKLEVHLSLSWSLNRNDDEMEATIDLSQFARGAFNDKTHQYVGFKLASEDFKLYDIAWASKTYENEGCFSNPTLVCSFKQNYTEGRVPVNEDVKPWYSTSAFAMEEYKGCQIKFTYNGCDNKTSKNNCTYPDKGVFYDESGDVKLNNDTSGIYHFTVEGLHGYRETSQNLFTNRSGIAYDAKVKIVCNSNATIPSSLYNAVSCGEFFVGPIEPCRDNVNLITSEQTCSDELCVIDLGKKVNLRDADVVFDFNAAAMSGAVGFKDNRGNESVLIDIASQNQKVTASALDRLSFDPQSIQYILVRPEAGKTIKIKQAWSVCPNAMGISNCQASYDGEKWTVTANVRNGEKCVVKSVGQEASNADGLNKDEDCVNGTYTALLKETAIEDRTYKFEVMVHREGGTTGESCQTNEVKILPKVDPITLNCSGNDKTGVDVGAQVTINPSVSGCDGKCSYSLKNGADVFASGSSYSSGYINFTDNKISATNAVQSKDYTLTISKEGTDSQSCNVKVTYNAKAAEEQNINAECGFSTSTDGSNRKNQFTVGDHIYFVAKDNNNNNTSGINIKVDKGNGSVESFNLANTWRHLDIGTPNTPTTYTYTLKDEAGSKTLCTASATVTAPSSGGSDFTCSVDKSEISLGESVTITASTNANPCYDLHIEYMDGFTNYTSTSCNNGSFNITPTKMGNYEVVIKINGDNNPLTCKQSVNVKAAAGGGQGSGGYSFNNLNNAIALAKDTEMSVSAGTMVSYTLDANNTLQIGCWNAEFSPATMQVRKCDGTVETISHPANNWYGLNVGGQCTIYLIPSVKATIKFSNW